MINLAKIPTLIIIAIFALLYLCVLGWINYLDRESNIRKFEVSDFTLSCSKVVRVGSSYLTISTKEHGDLTSLDRVAYCHDLIKKTYKVAKVTARKNQNIAFELDLDGQNVTSYEQSKSDIYITVAIYSIASLLIVLGFRNKQKKRLNNKQ